MLASSPQVVPQVVPRVPPGPARPRGYFWPRFRRGPTPIHTQDSSACVPQDLAGRSCRLLSNPDGCTGRGYCNPLLTGSCCLVLKRRADLAPAGVRAGLDSVLVPYQLGDPQVFQGNGVVGPDEHQGCLVMERAAVASHGWGLTREQLLRCAATVTALLASAHTPLGLGEALLGLAGVARVLDGLSP